MVFRRQGRSPGSVLARRRRVGSPDFRGGLGWVAAAALLATLVAAPGCGCNRGFFSGQITGVNLSIDSANVLAAGGIIDVFVIDSTVGTGETTTNSLPIEGRPVQTVESVNLLFDNELGGMRVFLDVTAFNDMNFVASGSTDVELITGEIIPAGVVLSTCEAADGPFLRRHGAGDVYRLRPHGTHHLPLRLQRSRAALQRLQPRHPGVQW